MLLGAVTAGVVGWIETGACVGAVGWRDAAVGVEVERCANKALSLEIADGPGAT